MFAPALILYCFLLVCTRLAYVESTFVNDYVKSFVSLSRAPNSTALASPDIFKSKLDPEQTGCPCLSNPEQKRCSCGPQLDEWTICPCFPSQAPQNKTCTCWNTLEMGVFQNFTQDLAKISGGSVSFLPSDVSHEDFQYPFTRDDPFSHKEDGCFCMEDPRDHVLACHCRGDSVTDIPSNLTQGIVRLSVTSASIEALRNGTLQNYGYSLEDLKIHYINEMMKELFLNDTL
ncbi:uncharacterized protein LOC111087062 [Limulus polyphemus]|uniref:Uncharacterized protein LOC111087062 n=1 Tax=Limulus polyphemus TaxID=6850 RepID=A0ABM1SWN2_LIMPO|nr:uncharacterized protein LOC111087062 [Limulus polyphemus]